MVNTMTIYVTTKGSWLHVLLGQVFRTHAHNHSGTTAHIYSPLQTTQSLKYRPSGRTLGFFLSAGPCPSDRLKYRPVGGGNRALTSMPLHRLIDYCMHVTHGCVFLLFRCLHSCGPQP
eukprot:204735-Amphidinium_carterae.1